MLQLPGVTHSVRCTDGTMEVIESDAIGVTVVEGNHGGTKLPCENPRSKKTFRVLVLTGIFKQDPPLIVGFLGSDSLRKQ